MKRGWAICRAGNWNPATAADRVLLDSGDRHRRRIVLTGEKGPFLLDLDEPVALRNGDGIVLDDGSIVMIASQAEQLAEIAARTPLADDTLRTFRETPAGPWLLAAVAVGLALFGLFSGAMSRWREV